MEPTHNFLSIANRFLFNKNVKIHIKLLWMLIILSSLSVFLFSINTAWNKLIVIPVIEIKIERRSIQSAPFPAITICSPVFARNGLVTQNDIFDESANLTDYQKEVLAANAQACNPTYAEFYPEWLKFKSSENIVKLLEESSLKIDEIIALCVLNNLIIDCNLTFKKILTDRGFCYTTNSQGFHAIFNPGVLSHDFDSHKATGISKSFKKFDELFNDTSADDFSDWGLDGFKKSHNPYSVPITAFKYTKMSFHLHLDPINANNICSKNGRSFFFFYHPPNEIVTPSNWENGIDYGFDKKIAIKIESYSINNQLKMLPPSARNCFNFGEKLLKFFKTYTKNLCEFECLTNYTLELCGCVKFSMPRTANTPVCGIKDLSCYKKAINTWPVENIRKHAPCGCLRNCHYFKYTSRFEKNARLKEPVILRKYRNILNGSGYALLSFEVVDHFLDHNLYYQPYTLQSFVADVGGLLGLFLGFSLLTIVEIAYGLMKLILKKIMIQIQKLY